MASRSDNASEAPRRVRLPDVGNVLVNRYEIRRKIGEGGMGTVVEAWDRRLERKVAIKLLHAHLGDDEDFARRFEREVAIAKDLEHNNTVRIYDYGSTEAGVRFLVMEYLEGTSFREEIDKGPMTLRRVVGLGTQLLDGLAEAHAMNVVHRDLKPGNILLSKGRRGRVGVKILDFGIARSLDASRTSITEPGAFFGTAQYTAPEIFEDGQVSKQSDIYACGLILLEMLFGRPVFDVERLPQLLQHHIHTEVVLPPTLNRHALGPILRRAVSKKRADRFPDAEAMFAVLRELPLQDGDDRVLPAEEVELAIQKMISPEEEHESKQTKKPQIFADNTIEIGDHHIVGARQATIEIDDDLIAESAAAVPAPPGGEELLPERTMEIGDDQVMEVKKRKGLLPERTMEIDDDQVMEVKKRKGLPLPRPSLRLKATKDEDEPPDEEPPEDEAPLSQQTMEITDDLLEEAEELADEPPEKPTPSAPPPEPSIEVPRGLDEPSLVDEIGPLTQPNRSVMDVKIRRKRPALPWLIGGGVVIVLLLVVAIVVIVNRGDDPEPEPDDAALAALEDLSEDPEHDEDPILDGDDPDETIADGDEVGDDEEEEPVEEEIAEEEVEDEPATPATRAPPPRPEPRPDPQPEPDPPPAEPSPAERSFESILDEVLGE